MVAGSPQFQQALAQDKQAYIATGGQLPGSSSSIISGVPDLYLYVGAGLLLLLIIIIL
jgi:hypothetical protein